MTPLSFPKSTSAIAAFLAIVLALTPVSAYASTHVGAAPSLSGKSSAPSLTAQAKKAKSGWVKTKKATYYYVKGKPAKGLKKIKGTYYYFNAKGVLQKKDVNAGNATFYVNKNGSVFGAKLGSKYYYSTLKKMTSSDAYNFATYIKARSKLNSICKKGDSKAKKRHKAFAWVVKQKYTHRHWYNFNHKKAKWIPYHARCILNGKGGDCHSSSAAYAYMLAAMGYWPKIHLDDYAQISHCWVELKGKYYDAAFAKWNGEKGYYESSHTKYTPYVSYTLPWYSPTNASPKAKVPSALLKAGQAGLKSKSGALYWYENGKKVKNAWRTINGKRYYFTSNGQAATSSTKIKGTYYVFDKKGALQTSSSNKLRTVNVAGVVFRVYPDGKAAPGWASDHSAYFDLDGAMLKNAWRTIDGKPCYFNENGEYLTGIQVIGSEFYATSSDGTYLPELTQQLNAAAQAGAKATTLRRLIGAPNQQAYTPSCNFDGNDGMWVYDHFSVTTARPSAVTASIEDAIAAEDAGEPTPAAYETITGIYPA